jgi:hypothetical protein
VSGKLVENEFDFILKAREEARKVVEYYKKYLDDAMSVEIPFRELRGVKKLRKIAALDGGERLKNLVASSVVIVRGGGGIFEQDEKIKKKIMHDIFITSMIKEVERFSNLFRDILEFKIALNLLEEEPEALIMDGSLVGYVTHGIPNEVAGYLGRPVSEKPIQEYVEKYKEYLRLFDKLLKTCQSKKILLLGVSKDSRVHYLINKFKLDPVLTDYALLKLKMKKPSVTEPIIAAYRWQNEAIHDFALKNNYLSDDLASFNICYFKLKYNSIPIRVDFPEWQRGRFYEIMELMETYHDNKGFLMTAHLVHNWAVMKETIVNSTVNAIREEVLKLDPSIYDAIFAPQRREEI